MNAQIFGRHVFSHSYPLVLAVAAVMLAVPANAVLAASETVDLDADARWDVSYLGRHYDAERDETTFRYHVVVNKDPGLDHFTVGLPPCEPGLLVVRTAPEGATFLDPASGAFGVRWSESLDPGQDRSYAVTVAGEKAEGDVGVVVEASGIVAFGTRVGPSCDDVAPPGGGGDGRFDIVGTVFLDADRDGNLAPDEPRFPAVTVVLQDAFGVFMGMTMTYADGSYRFLDLPEGGYQVVLKDTSPVDGFNGLLYAYFVPLTDPVRPVVLVSSDSQGNDFGFTPDVGAILADFDSQDPDGDGFTFVGTGRNARFWERQFTVAVRERGRAELSPLTLVRHVEWIRGFYLVEPFQFADDFRGPLEVLSSNSREPSDVLTRALLAAEFNQAAGWGLSEGFDMLQMVLLEWGEVLVSRSAWFGPQELSEAAAVFEAINDSGE